MESLASHAKWCLADIEQHLARESFEQPKHSQTILGHTASRNLREKANVTRRWHDNRHTLITDLAESGASDQTIMDIAGHVSKQMLKHYSHICMEAKRTALESIVQKQPAEPVEAEQNHAPLPTVTQQIEGEYPQKSPQSGNLGKVCGGKKERKSLKRIGSSGRIRTYNPSVNSRMLYR